MYLESEGIMYLIFWLFFVYAFLGWCAEVCFVSVNHGYFVNRGFLNGPVCPIYGFGALIVLTCLTPLQENKLVLFVGSMVLTSALELLTGIVLEKLFHQQWWDYSDEPFNLKGYICLKFSIMWGFACMFVVYFLHPTILWLIGLIPHTLGMVFLGLMSAVMLVDLVATVRTITKMNRQLSQIEELAGRVRELSDELGGNLAEKALDAVQLGAGLKVEIAQRREELQEDLDDLKEDLVQRREDVQEKLTDLREELALHEESVRDERIQRRQERRDQRQEELDELRARLEEVLNHRSFGQRRMLRAFPGLRSRDHKQALERLRQWMEGK